MPTYDIIPDIHGQSEKLKGALGDLGYQYRNGAWHHRDPNRQCLFLGDFIDRGPNNREVLTIVRNMMEAGTATAIMGNHELNAIHYHTSNSENTDGLRKRNSDNTKQHQSFLNELPLHNPETKSAIDWMCTLPLYHEQDGFRAVHACWNDQVVAELKAVSSDGVLTKEQLYNAAHKSDMMFKIVETLTKGPEAKLPHPYFITDKNGKERHHVRLQWWNRSARTWPEIAISVTDVSQLPQEELPPTVAAAIYPSDAKPVFFGHYWLTGDAVLQAPNALCLDYSAGAEDGHLVSYKMSDAGEALSLENLTLHSM